MPMKMSLCAAVAAGAAMLLVPSPASAKTVPAEIRVVTADGEVLAHHVQYTGTTRVRTNRKATCLKRGGPRPSGGSYRLAGATALGMASQAAEAQRKLRPFWVSDASEFGLGVCRFGKASATGDGGWLFTHNRAYAMAGADATALKRNDKTLWYLVEDWASAPDGELELRAPARAKLGSDVTVRVFRYDGAGNRAPAVGARIHGTDAAPTDSEGRTSVTMGGRRNVLQARAPGVVASNVIRVCAGARCPAGHVARFFGTGKRDRINVRGPVRAVVKARGGRDVIDLRRAKHRAKSVNCGPGKDRLIIKRGKRPAKVKSCERIVRR